MLENKAVNNIISNTTEVFKEVSEEVLEEEKRLPIMEFFNQEEMDICLKEWKHTLGLDDWHIRVCVTYASHLDSLEYTGQNEWSFLHKCSAISLIDKEEYGSRMLKYCAEEILIHELLHLIIGAESSWEDMNPYERAHEHQKIENLARSFLCAKYGISLDFFWEVKGNE